MSEESSIVSRNFGWSRRTLKGFFGKLINSENGIRTSAAFNKEKAFLHSLIRSSIDVWKSGFAAHYSGPTKLDQKPGAIKI